MRQYLRNERKQFRELAKLFFGRFLENDLISLDGDTRATLVNILALVAAPGIIFPLQLMRKFGGTGSEPVYLRDWASLPEKAFFVCFSMTVLGIVTVLEWDALFPDRRDYTVLRPFPIRLATIFAAKIAALAGFWAIFTLAINAVSPVIFPAVVMQRASLAGLAWFTRCHIVAVLAGNAFVFLSLIAVQGLLMNLLGWRRFRRVSPYAQFVLIAALLMMFFNSGAPARWIDPAKPASFALAVFPPAWFLGLYQYELGWSQPVFRELAEQARLALWIAAAGAALAYALSYKRHIRRSLEALDSPATRPGRTITALTNFADRFVLRSAAERASFHFVWHTMFRSRRHKVLLAAYVGVGFALVFQVLAGVMAAGRSSWWHNPTGVLLPVPLVLSFFLLCGIRYVFTVPAELPANWIFQVSGRTSASEYMAGVRKAVVLLGIAPLFACLLLIHLAIWDWTAAVLHILFGCTIAVLIMEVLLVGFEKLPFTCSYLPGKANMKVFWPIYATGFVIYVGVFSTFEYLILSRPIRVVGLFAFAAACKVCLYYYRNRMLIKDFEFIYEDQPEPAVRTLNLLPP